jgi:hypothetical protein
MKAENYLQSIDQKLTRATAEKDHHVPAERLAEGLSEVLKGFLDGVEGAEKVRQADLQRAEPFKGSPAYEQSKASADEVYSGTVYSLAEASKKAVKSAVRALRERYESGALSTIPEPVMQQLQLFNMLKHPAASQYQHFERIFRKYPQVQEVLVNKYNFDQNSDPSYVPKFESGAVFEPYTPLSDASVQQKLDSLLRSSYSLVDATVEGNSAIESQIAKNVKNAKDPVETIRATCSWGTPETQEFLGTVDRNFAPGESETSPEDAAVEAYENDRAYTAEVKAGQADPAIQQKALDYYTK